MFFHTREPNYSIKIHSIKNIFLVFFSYPLFLREINIEPNLHFLVYRNIFTPKIQLFIPTVATKRKVMTGKLKTYFRKQIKREPKSLGPRRNKKIIIFHCLYSPKYIFIVLTTFLNMSKIMPDKFLFGNRYPVTRIGLSQRESTITYFIKTLLPVLYL